MADGDRSDRILMYADRNGSVQHSPVRRMLCIVGGIVGSEGNGPLDPTPKPGGLVLAGNNAVAFDLVCAHLMGFGYKWLPVLRRVMAKQL